MGEKTRVLIVDDDADLGRALSLILTRKGYEVVVVENGTRAVEEAKQDPFGLILIDVMMPDKSGLDTLRELKEIDPQARIVMMTGYAVAGLVAEAVQVGVDGVLYKPFDVEVVVDTLMSEDVLRLYEGYLKTVWDRVVPIVGSVTAASVFSRTVQMSVQKEGSLLEGIEVTERGISLEGLRRQVYTEAGQSAELRSQLRGLLAAIFELLGMLAGSILTDPLIKKLSDELKGEGK